MIDRLRVLIVGGYGTFGGRLARLLADEPRLTLLIAGRSLRAASAFRRPLISFPRDLIARTTSAPNCHRWPPMSSSTHPVPFSSTATTPTDS